MRTDREATRIVRSWLEEGRTALPDYVLDAVLDELPATRQRLAWWPAWRFAQINAYALLAIGVASVAVIAIAGISFLPRTASVGKPVATPSPSPFPTPGASSLVLPTTSTSLSPGTYSLASFPVGITFEVPEGWGACSVSAIEQSVCSTTSNSGLSFLIVDNVVADPCDGSEALLKPPVGSSVDDLVSAISSLKGFEATTPQDTTVDGFDGKDFTVTAPASPGVCDLRTWATPDRTNGVSAGEVNLLLVLDVNGTRIVIAGAYQPGDPNASETLSALRQIRDSVRIQP